MCIGRDVSIMEAQLVLAMMVQRYKLWNMDRREPPPRGGVNVSISRR